MSERLLSNRRDALFPEGFGKILKPAEKPHSVAAVMRLINAHADDVLRHGAVLLEREDVRGDLAEDVPDGLKVVSSGFSTQLLHAHPGAIGLIAPVANDTPTVFCSVKTQRASLRHFGRTPEAQAALFRFPSLARLMAPEGVWVSNGRMRIVALLNGVLDAVAPLHENEMNAITNDVYRMESELRQWEAHAESVATGTRAAQEHVAEDLMAVDWNRFIACEFRGGLPHARGMLTTTKRRVPMYAQPRGN